MKQAFREHRALSAASSRPAWCWQSVLRGCWSPTENEERHALEGNLCRCTGYHNIVKAVLAAAEQQAQ
jgi:carbon-monoxide dehydrogenase small subunit